MGVLLSSSIMPPKPKPAKDEKKAAPAAGAKAEAKKRPADKPASAAGPAPKAAAPKGKTPAPAPKLSSKTQQLLPRSQLKALPPPKLLPLRLLLLKLHQRRHQLAKPRNLQPRKPLPRQLPKLLLRPRLPPKLPPRLLLPRSQPLKSQRQRLPPPRLCLPSARSSRASMEPEQGRFAPQCSSDAPRPSVLHATQNTPVSLPPKGARWMPTTSSSTH